MTTVISICDVDETVAGIKRQHNVFEQLGIDPQEAFGLFRQAGDSIQYLASGSAGFSDWLGKIYGNERFD